jgi:hypothetical protein
VWQIFLDFIDSSIFIRLFFQLCFAIIVIIIFNWRSQLLITFLTLFTKSTSNSGSYEQYVWSYMDFLHLIFWLLIVFILKIKYKTYTARRGNIIHNIGEIFAYYGLLYHGVLVNCPTEVKNINNWIKSDDELESLERIRAYSNGPTMKQYKPVIVDTGDWGNQLDMLRHRVFKQRPAYDVETCREFKQWVIDNINKLYPWHKEFPMSRAQWVETYSGQKRKLIERVHHDWLTAPTIDDINMSHWKQLKDFGKDEALMQCELKSMRNIGGRYDLYNYQWGNLCNSFSKILAKVVNTLLNKQNIFCYMSGMNRTESGEVFNDWMDYVTSITPDPDSYISDFSMYDETVNRYLMETETVIIRHFLFCDYYHLCMLNIAKYSFKGFTKFHRFRLPKNMMMLFSGDQTTTSGNTSRSLIMRAFQLCTRILHCKAEDLHLYPVRMGILGDDGVTVASHDINQAMINDTTLQKLGMKLKHRVVDIDHAEFCSSYFVPNNDTYAMLPKIGRILGKTFWNSVEVTDEHVFGYARCIAQGFAIDYHTLPIGGMIMKKVIQVTNGVKAWVPKFVRNHMKFEIGHLSQHLQADQSTLDWFYRVYQTTPHQVTDFEKRLSDEFQNLHTPIFTLDHPLLTKMFEIDNGFSYHDVDPEIINQQHYCVPRKNGPTLLSKLSFSSN